jgi:hypothetical protein
MRATIRCMFPTLALALVLCVPAGAQENELTWDTPLKRLSMPFYPSQPATGSATKWKIPGKRVSQYTMDDWGTWIDSTWGAGQSSSTQQQIFDGFWDAVDKYWAGFPNLSVDWDSVRDLYRPQIDSGLSRGRFAALMSRVSQSLLEYHTYTYDRNVEAILGDVGNGTWHYRPDIPLLIIGTMWWDLLGAPITALPDSTGLVYRTAPGNPLNLEPGDIVLGYEGVPWKQLYRQLLDHGVPISRYWSLNGSTPAGQSQLALSSVGWNWGMFDTIDIVKHSTGDTLHLSTAPLENLSQTVLATEQVPVPDVPMPTWPGGNSVSWGVVDGTNIGYVYVWDWYSPNTSQLFVNAITDLRRTKSVDGLIIDFRMNWGGNFALANAGLAQLFGFDPTRNSSIATRTSTTDHLGFTLGAAPWGFAPTDDPFQRPIAVLIGPGCLSVGDYNAFRLRFHPMARYFGRPTNGAFVAGSDRSGELAPGWPYMIPTSSMYSNVPGEGFLMHKGVQPDEEVWLTRDGVARGEDDVVKRALEWISSLSYAHDITVSEPGFVAAPAVYGTLYAASDTLYSVDMATGRASKIGWIGPDPVHGLAVEPKTGEMYGVSTTSQNTVLYRVSGSTSGHIGSRRSADSVRITAVVENPGVHTLVVSAIITNSQGSVVDSVVLVGDSGSTLWSASIMTPPTQGKYGVSVRTEDVTAGSFRRLPNVASFTVDQTHVERTIPIPNMRAIAFDREGTLYGATLNGRLYRIVPSTADTVLIGTATGIVYSSVAFHPSTGELWASVRPVVSGRDRIYKVNTATGVATLVGATGGGRITPAIAFSPDQVLFGLKYAPLSDTLITISTENASASAVGLTGIPGLNALAMIDRPDEIEERPEPLMPGRFVLEQNYPNPFNPSTTIRYALPARSRVTLSVFNTLGQQIATLVEGEMEVGHHEVTFDASSLASGVYLYRLTAGDYVQARRLVLLK